MALCLKQDGGSIINTASVSGPRGYDGAGESAHALVKGGVIALTRQLAAEDAKHNIRVNTISPDTVMTPALAVLSAEELDVMNKAPPIGHSGQPEALLPARYIWLPVKQNG